MLVFNYNIEMGCRVSSAMYEKLRFIVEQERHEYAACRRPHPSR
jgi:hypothetical protein